MREHGGEVQVEKHGTSVPFEKFKNDLSRVIVWQIHG